MSDQSSLNTQCKLGHQPSAPRIDKISAQCDPQQMHPSTTAYAFARGRQGGDDSGGKIGWEILCQVLIAVAILICLIAFAFFIFALWKIIRDKHQQALLIINDDYALQSL